MTGAENVPGLFAKVGILVTGSRTHYDFEVEAG